MPESRAASLPLAEELGYLLARTREERGLSIEKVAKAIHMRKHYIEALEKGEFTDLPGAIYVRGYLKRYAEFLQLDVETVLSTYDQLERPEPRKFFILPVSLERNPYPSARLAVVCLCVSMSLYLFWGQAQKQAELQLVQSFASFETAAGVSILPHRCDGNYTAYPPCYWEQLGLWYQFYPNTHYDLYAGH